MRKNNMKLLLTSGGITNPSIASALFGMTSKKPEELTLVFIPTASNAETGDKDWLINDLLNLKKLNLGSIEITDISAVDETIWKPSIKRADILFFEGGNTYHLMEWMNKSGLTAMMPELLKTKIYVGVSAGSIVTNKDMQLKIGQAIYEEDLDKNYELEGLNLVDFYFLPHLNSPYFTNLSEEHIREFTKDINDTIYALDDESAIKIVDGELEVISEGEWFVIEK